MIQLSKKDSAAVFNGVLLVRSPMRTSYVLLVDLGVKHTFSLSFTNWVLFMPTTAFVLDICVLKGTN